MPRLINQAALLDWYRREARQMPWRGVDDVYAIWVSEVMLQQTQVETVRPYFLRWMLALPTLGDLAKASESDVLSLWQGLGYYRRAKMLRLGALFVLENGVPRSASEWRRVPGVGAYTAGAIASLALNEATPAVDGNVERVYARLCADYATSSALNRNAWTWARANMHQTEPAKWNQALIELGATICRPRKPLCAKCPISSECRAFAKGIADQLPVRAKKLVQTELSFTCRIHVYDGCFLLEKSTGPWWEGMWIFPTEEGNPPPETREANVDRECLCPGLPNVEPRQRITGAQTSPVHMGLHSSRRSRSSDGYFEPVALGVLSHQLTRHKLKFHPLLFEHSVQLVQLVPLVQNQTWFDGQTLENLPMPSPHRKMLELAQQRISDIRRAEALLGGVSVAG